MIPWSASTLGDIAAETATGPFGSAVSSKHFVNDGVPMLRGSNLSDDIGKRIDTADLVFLPESIVEQFPRAVARAGDLVFTCWGTIGQIGLLDGREAYDRFLVSNKQMRLRPDPQQVDPTFLYYYLSQPWMVDLVRGQAIGSSVPGFNLGQLRSLPIRFPALPAQQAIAEVLGALDDKIAANTALAATIDSYLAGLLDELASGNGTTKLGSIADVNKRSVKPIADGSLRYVDIASVTVGSFDYPERSEWADAPGRARRGLSLGDTMWSTVRPNRRSHALNLEDDPMLVASTGLAILSPRDVGFAFLYEATKRPEFAAYLENVAEGSAYPAVRADRFLDAPVPDIPAEGLASFEAQAAPLRELVASQARENRALAATRDALLPQLMSGRIRVREAHRIASEVNS
ncbi:restriction endonuclease subunit S [Microbacter sp. GSS18]|nr:restriction endonuclease subunit S [Microbacter sp. GSS18]